MLRNITAYYLLAGSEEHPSYDLRCIAQRVRDLGHLHESSFGVRMVAKHDKTGCLKSRFENELAPNPSSGNLSRHELASIATCKSFHPYKFSGRTVSRKGFSQTSTNVSTPSYAAKCLPQALSEEDLTCYLQPADKTVSDAKLARAGVNALGCLVSEHPTCVRRTSAGKFTLGAETSSPMEAPMDVRLDHHAMQLPELLPPCTSPI
ncbi:hypothetical protein MRB53_041495 [Persea americana]|nr:hypothetical protein MRB53_041495 [Persea americana]